AAVAATRTPVRIGLARHRNAAFLTHVLAAEDPHKPVVEEQARLLTALDIHSSGARYRLDADRLGDLRDDVRRQLPPRFAALHPFASVRERCLPLSEWTQLAFALQARGLPVLWIGTPGELAELRSFTHPRGYYVDQLGDGRL